MKKIIIACVLMLTCVASVFGFASYLKPNIADKTISVAAKIDTAYAATANTTEVQKKLKRWGYYTGSVDGINGPKTKAAVKKFQKKYGLVQDGIVGPLTAAKMGLTVSGSSSSSNYTSNDRYLLAKVIYAEARGESYTGQVAIGAVVLNRVEDSRFLVYTTKEVQKCVLYLKPLERRSDV